MNCRREHGRRERKSLGKAFALTGASVAAARRGSSTPAVTQGDYGRSSDECLNVTEFTSLDHARATLTAWQDDYNLRRPQVRWAI